MGLKLKISDTVIVLANSVGEPCEEVAVCAMLIEPDFYEFAGGARTVNTAVT
jgi:hypothetical protein